MANTYTQLYIHYVFAVQNRLSLIRNNWQNDLYKYMNGIVNQQGHKPFAINGMPDHVHILVSMSPVQTPSDLMYHIKRSSSLWINENKFVSENFHGKRVMVPFLTANHKYPILPDTSITSKNTI